MDEPQQHEAPWAQDRRVAMTMRVLLVGEGDLSHGSFLRRTAEALGKRDGVHAEVRIVEAPQGVRARLIAPVPRLGDLDLQPLRWRLRYSWHARRMLDDVGGADVVLLHTQSIALLAAEPMRRVPTVVSTDMTGRQYATLEYWRPRGRAAVASELPLEALERRALQRAARVIAWTEWTACSLRDDYGIPAERVAVVHPGLDVTRWDVEHAPPRTSGPLRILFVGNFVWRKGLATLLAALPLVDRPLELHVVTGDELTEPLGEHVTVHRGLAPGSEELRRRFTEADVFALPTQADGVPWVVAEAMAAGLPVVASDIAAIPSMLGDAGLVTPPGDAAALAGALRELADDPARCVALGERARARAHDHYDEERQLGRMVDVLRAACADRSRVAA
jgi:glycosyltransferase involved in cell wall biosynthesis